MVDCCWVGIDPRRSRRPTARSGSPACSRTPPMSCTSRTLEDQGDSFGAGQERRRRRQDARPPAAHRAVARGLHRTTRAEGAARPVAPLRRAHQGALGACQAGRQASLQQGVRPRRAAVPVGARTGENPAPAARQHAGADRRLHARDRRPRERGSLRDEERPRYLASGSRSQGATCGSGFRGTRDASSSGHETAALKVAVRARPYGRPTGTGAFAENAVGQAVCGR
jgi:hypothetical protein